MFRILGLATVLLVTFPSNLVSATCYGANTCLEGWVWRQAIPTDYVCVTPDVRTQTAQDNANAKSRVNPNGGPYGPDTCLNGYVWREAYTSDHVCVLPATRTEAANDNAQAANRVASLNVSVYDWSPGPDLYPNMGLKGDHFNYGSVQVAIFDNRDNPIQDWTTVTAVANSGYIDGSWEFASTVPYCTTLDPPGTTDGYALAQDMTSGCYSARIPVDFCYTL